MPRLTLACGPIVLELDPGVGAGVSDLSLLSPGGDRTPLLRRAPGGGSGSEQLGCFLMLPWTNRIRAARFAFAGREHALRRNHADGTAIHGDARERAWRVRHRTPMSATLRFDSREHDEVNFPFPFVAAVRYEVASGGVEIELDVTNSGDAPMPVGCGLHPYFMRRLWADDDRVELRVPVAGRYPSEACLPVSAARWDGVCDRLCGGGALGDIELDDVFALDRFEAEIVWPTSGVRVTMSADEEAGHAVIYTPRAGAGSTSPGPWFCVEPTTMVNDGFNLAESGWQGTGVRACAPGESLSLHFQLRIDRV